MAGTTQGCTWLEQHKGAHDRNNIRVHMTGTTQGCTWLDQQKWIGSWRVWHFYHTFRPCWPRRHWHRLLGTKWQHSRPCFRDFQIAIFKIKQDQKSSKGPVPNKLYGFCGCLSTMFTYLWVQICCLSIFWNSYFRISFPRPTGPVTHSEHRFPAPSSKLCQI